jgi:mannose-1-phosphate guanylyltransferase/phosphomannomutase
MINRAMMAGLMSAGVNCNDMRATSIPIVRHRLRSGKERGGIHVRRSPYDRNHTDIIFFDAGGKDLQTSKTKSVERLFFGEDFPRAQYRQVGSIHFPERATEGYIERFLDSLKTDTIRGSGLKLVIDYSHGIASTIFPNILGDLNLDVIALNAYLDSDRLTRSAEQHEAALRQLAYVVTSLRYDVGVMLDPGAQRISVVDEEGAHIDSDRILTLMTKLMCLAHPVVSTVAVPITATGEIDLLAREHGFSVIRTRDSHLALMDAASSRDPHFIGGTRGGFIFKEFLIASDGMYSAAKLLELMATTGMKIGQLDRQTPRLRFVKRDIPCPWHIKGQVMRLAMKQTESMKRQLIEGIKIFPKNGETTTTVLLNPDRARPVFHIYAESDSIDIAEALAGEYEERVREWIRSE